MILTIAKRLSIQVFGGELSILESCLNMTALYDKWLSTKIFNKSAPRLKIRTI